MKLYLLVNVEKVYGTVLVPCTGVQPYVRPGSDAKACPIARGKFDSKKHGFGQVHGLI